MMMEDDPTILTEAEMIAEFDRFFPQGFAGPDVLKEIVADGWEQGTDPDDVRDWMGRCLWEVFSDNHEVVAADGRVFDLGSFRYAGGFIADLMNAQVKHRCYDYMDCYLGTVWLTDLGRDCSPFHRLIFRRLKHAGLDWVYHFPELHVVDLRPLRDALAQKQGAEWENYSPEAALAKEKEEAERDKQINELREKLKEGHRQDVEEAQKHPPPRIVEAYRAVYGKLPSGWPPVA